MVKNGMTTINTDCDSFPEDALITSVCLGLVVLWHEVSPLRHHHSGFVELSHYAIRDRLSDVSIPHPSHLAIACQRILSFGAFKRSSDDGFIEELMDTPFVQYAANFWGEHIRVNSSEPTVRSLAMEFLQDQSRISALGLLAYGIEGITATHLAARFGLADYLTSLVRDNSADINSMDSNGDTPLTIAVSHGHEEIAQLLLAQEGAQVNLGGWGGITPLIQAIKRERRRITELLLGRGDVNVNQHDDGGMTPMAHAAIHGDSGLVHLLLSRDDLGISSRDTGGNTPLAWAIFREHEAIVDLLLEKDLDAAGTFKNERDGNTCLTIAAHNDNGAIADLLLRKLEGRGLDVNSENREGQMTFAVAAYRGNDTVVKVLLDENGIDVNAVSSEAKTPLDWAESPSPLSWHPTGDFMERKRGTIKLLPEAGARRGAQLKADLESGGRRPDSVE